MEFSIRCAKITIGEIRFIKFNSIGSMKTHNKLLKTEQYWCSTCKTRRMIQRPSGKVKSMGHFKKMWCVGCQAEVNFVKYL